MQQGGGGGAFQPAPAASGTQAASARANVGGVGGVQRPANGGRFDFDDGGTYCGGWEDGKAHGHGVCTGPKGQGEYSGSWHFGFEVSGVYTWPSGSTFEGQWQNGKRHGLGVEARGRWLYRGEWTQGFKGRYGVRQSTTSAAKYEGTWANGLQDGYGSETYADGGTYQGQWMRGMRHGYGVRTSAPFGLASHYRPKGLRASLTSLRSDNAPAAGAIPDTHAANQAASSSSAAAAAATAADRRLDDARGGFVLKARSDEAPARRRSLGEKSANLKKSILQGLKIRRQRSTGDLEKRGTSASIRSTGSSASWVSTDSAHSAVTSASQHTDSNASFVVEDDQLDPNVTETYMGEWKNDKRSGFGISERSDGLRYEGEWYNNKKYGYGVTTLKDGTREEGKYKNNVLVTSQKKKQLFLIRSAKFRERVDAAVSAAQRASKIALQKADIAISRTATARGKGEQADLASAHAREDSEVARLVAKQFAPDFHQPGTETLKQQLAARGGQPDLRTLGAALRPREDTTSPHARSQSMYGQPPRPPSLPHAIPNDEDILQVMVPPASAMTHAAPPPSYAPPPPPATSYAPAASYAPPASYAPAPMMMPNHVPPGPTTLEVPAKSANWPDRNASISGPSQQQQAYSYRQAMNDHFDHYKRPPSVSREPSQDRGNPRGPPPPVPTTLPDTLSAPGMGSRRPSVMRGSTPAPPAAAMGNGPVNPAPNLMPANPGPAPATPTANAGPASLLEELLAAQSRSRSGQDIPPAVAGTPKRTESLFVRPKEGAATAPSTAVATAAATAASLRRKKSLPEAPALPTSTTAMSREEVSVLSSARREQVRKEIEEAERVRQNPLLYLCSPHVKDWFSRQQLMMLVLFVNISLAVMFLKLLT